MKFRFAWKIVNLYGISLWVIKYMRGDSMFRSPCGGKTSCRLPHFAWKVVNSRNFVSHCSVCMDNGSQLCVCFWI